MRLRLKDSTINIDGLSAEMIAAIQSAMWIWALQGIRELVITSANDGTHKDGSLHYEGQALDLRSRNLTDQVKARDMLQDELGDDYDVILELTHIHVEFDPKS